MKSVDNKKEEFTNEQYREQLNELFASVEDNQFLRYCYILISKMIKGRK